MSAKKNCFVVGPIGDDGSEIRKRSDQTLKHIIIPSVEPLGYSVLRADKISEPGLITTQIVQHVLDDPLVVADLSGVNANVFYELALRHAIRKPLVQIIRKGDKIPFDIAGMRTVSIDLTDPDSIEEARTEIVKQVRSVEGKKPEDIDSPVSVAMELQSMRHSEKPEDRSYAQILSLIGDLQNSVGNLEKKISDSPRGPLPEVTQDAVLRINRMSDQILIAMQEAEQLFSRLDEKNKIAVKDTHLHIIETQQRLAMSIVNLRHSLRV